jgi:hypothetical protein
MIARKMKAAAVSAAIGWAMVVFVIATWVILDSSPLNPHKSLTAQVLHEASAKDLAGMALAMIAPWPLMWRTMAVSMWTSMTGHKWVSTALGLAFGLAVFAIPGLIGWIVKDPQRREQFISDLPSMLAAFVVLKLIVIAGIGLSLHRLELLSRRDLVRAGVLWLATTGLVLATIGFFVEWSWYAAAAAVLIVPLARIGAAPLALHWNRCR